MQPNETYKKQSDYTTIPTAIKYHVLSTYKEIINDTYNHSTYKPTQLKNIETAIKTLKSSIADDIVKCLTDDQDDSIIVGKTLPETNKVFIGVGDML